MVAPSGGIEHWKGGHAARELFRKSETAHKSRTLFGFLRKIFGVGPSTWMGRAENAVKTKTG